MNRTFVDAHRFLFTSDVSERGFRHTVAVHWTAHQFQGEQAVKAVEAFVTGRVEVSEVWFVAPADVELSFDELRRQAEYEDRTGDLTHLVFRCFLVRSNGSWLETDAPGGPAPSQLEATEHVVSQVRADGMRQIFRDSEALVTASAGHHFDRPGRGHSVQFIRSSKAVARAQHAYFIASSALVQIDPQEGMALYSDTAGILPLLAAVQDLLRRLAKLTKVSIDSFGGYDGYEENLTPVVERDHLFISSSTSGNFAATLLKAERATARRMTTVYYLSEDELPEVRGGLLCDLTNRDRPAVPSVRDARLATYASYRAGSNGECDLCASGSRAIELVGDDFFPAPAELSLRLPVLGDRPNAGERGRLNRFDGAAYFKAFYGTGAITAEFGDQVDARGGSTGPSYGVSTRLETALSDLPREGAAVGARLGEVLNLVAPDPTEVQTVISLPDPGSRALAEFVLSSFAPRAFSETVAGLWREGAPLITIDDFILNSADLPNALQAAFGDVPAHTTVLVCAGVIGSGRAVLNLNRTLRLLPKGVDVVFMIGVAHPESSNSQTIFEGSLGVRSSKERSRFEIGWELAREPGFPSQPHPWIRERSTLDRVIGWLSRYGNRDEVRALELRVEDLQYLVDDLLFALPDISANERRIMRDINPKFALWPFEWSEDSRTRLGATPSQPEIYMTIAHFLHESRRMSASLDNNGIGARRHGFAINPALFDRLNEPRIQSAILRAVIPGELHYHASAAASRAATDIIRHALLHQDEEGGEAAYEFALSLCDGIVNPRGPGIKLAASDLRALLSSLPSSMRRMDSYPPLLRGMLLYLSGEHSS